MHASAWGWREQDRAAKRLILMLKRLLMVMFKTSKLRLTEKKHLHSDEVEQMSSLESVKVRPRVGGGHTDCPLNFYENSWRSCGLEMVKVVYIVFVVWPDRPPFICSLSKLHLPPYNHKPSFWRATVQPARANSKGRGAALLMKLSMPFIQHTTGHVTKEDAPCVGTWSS